jgi:hypothetical protein
MSEKYCSIVKFDRVITEEALTVLKNHIQELNVKYNLNAFVHSTSSCKVTILGLTKEDAAHTMMYLIDTCGNKKLNKEYFITESGKYLGQYDIDVTESELSDL